MARSGILEKDIQKTIIEWLGYQKRCFVWRQNSGAFYSDYKTGRHGFKTSSVEGVSDILGVWDGHPLAIEVKKPGGKLTDNQTMFLTSFAAAGGIAIIANSLEQVQLSMKRVIEMQKPFEGIFINNL